MDVEEEKDRILKMHDAPHVIGFNFPLPAKHSFSYSVLPLYGSM